MNSWNLMAVKAFMPAALVFVVAVLAAWVLSEFRDSAYLSGFADLGAWLPFGLVVVAFVLTCVTSVRLWRAERGLGRLCSCGGMLGAENARGRYGPYRKCMQCNRNVSNQHYS